MPMMKEMKKGQLVTSRAGRDKNTNYIIFDWDTSFVFVVDGEYKRIGNPKKKNINHLWYSEKADLEINDKMEKGLKVTNKDIRDALERLLAKSWSKKGGFWVCLKK